MANIKLFENQNIRTHWDEETEKWYFSVVDVVAALTGTERPRKYWSDLKSKLKQEGSELSEKIGQLKMQSSDGKFYMTDIADTEQVLRLIQSIPSKIFFLKISAITSLKKLFKNLCFFLTVKSNISTQIPRFKFICMNRITVIMFF